jgi:tRNA 2-thiouridine synthesizing protein A
MKSLDVTGLSCPEPVIRTRSALKELSPGEKMEVVVDTVTARENVSRAALSMNCEISVEETGHQFRLTLQKKI